MVLGFISGILRNFELSIMKMPSEVLLSTSFGPDKVQALNKAHLAHRKLTFRIRYPGANCCSCEVSSKDR